MISGISTDILFVLCASLVGAVLRLRYAVPLMLVLALFYAANIEHVYYNFAHIKLGTIGFAFSWSFAEGSATSDFFENGGILIGLVLGILIVTWMRWVRYVLAPVALLALIAVLILPRSHDPLQSSWMQSHPLFPAAFAASGASTGFRATNAAFETQQPAPEAAGDTPDYNVLIVYLEGVSQFSLQQDDMKFLQGAGAGAFQFTRYFGNQIQTSNGLYTTLTGAMPNFLQVGSTWDSESAWGPATKSALPVLLRDRGYHTAFLQSADLAFMSKDKHMKQLGFEDVKGLDDWTRFHTRNGWGIDDLSLVENALSYIDDIDQTRPWMVTLLTSGTHAPYNVPEDFLPEERNRYRALRYADAAAETLVDGLRQRGLLDNTIVIFTADESREPGNMTNLENEILLNWLPLIVLHPDGQKGTVDWPVNSTQIRDLVLKFLGPWTLDDIKRMDQPEVPLVFGNYYNSRVFWYDRMREDLFACFTQDFLCAQLAGVADLTTMGAKTPVAVFKSPAMQKIFSANEKVD